MDVLIYLVPIALFLGLLGLGAFLWSLKSGQFDDLEGAKWRILSDDDLPDAKNGADESETKRNGHGGAR
ncbi:cbb3-type cytochrome oxidase assembly protein CcoS [Rhizobiales bacterium]|uniref:cbb3-type cytochrome oxidase assembly protein CcoS n=1 Tax=Hongsoonwoonella zoysiae TaxID=2821844 RepID=UPI0015605987|nr:cbb3-type cytochrome oxidase assembly protein CcoS [Hongsoonwoonella zoysiae]NRG19564.1 cbb3-type cytochrome oxidase assembly protein CcoS [Hongsoonwoonella zoysiae]